jgi:YD repeat-containing protein
VFAFQAGNVTSRRLRDAVSIGYTYDALNRLTGIDRPTFGYLDLLDSNFSYDNLGHMLTATHDSTSQPGQAQRNLSFGYDALGRQLSQTDPLGTVSYGYDLAGQRTSMTYPGSGLVIGYVYDAAGDPTEIRENPAGSNGLLATYAYDDRGRRASLTRNNGLVTGYSYDNVDRLTQLTQDVNGTSSDLTLGFGYNPAGQIVSNSRDNNAYSFTGHVNGARTDTADGLNRIVQVGGTNTAHDANGNLTYDPGSWGAGARSFGFSSEGALISAWPHSMLYDPLGRLVQTDTGSGFTIQRFG